MPVSPFKAAGAVPAPRVEAPRVKTNVELVLESVDPTTIRWMGHRFDGFIRLLGFTELVESYSRASSYLALGETWASAHPLVAHLAVCRATCETMWPDAPDWLKAGFANDMPLIMELYGRIERFRETRFLHGEVQSDGTEEKKGFQVLCGSDPAPAAVPAEPPPA